MEVLELPRATSRNCLERKQFRGMTLRRVGPRAGDSWGPVECPREELRKAVAWASGGRWASRRCAQVWLRAWTWLGPEGPRGLRKAGPLCAPVLPHLPLVMPWAYFPPEAARPDSVAGGCSRSGKDLAGKHLVRKGNDVCRARPTGPLGVLKGRGPSQKSE